METNKEIINNKLNKKELVKLNTRKIKEEIINKN